MLVCSLTISWGPTAPNLTVLLFTKLLSLGLSRAKPKDSGPDQVGTTPAPTAARRVSLLMGDLHPHNHLLCDPKQVTHPL